MTAAEVLRRAAEAYRNGDIQWGREWFIHSTSGCRCALGAVTYAIVPDDPDGNPFLIDSMPDSPRRSIGIDAANALATYLVEELGAPVCHYDIDGTWDAVEIIGGWNDDPARTPEQVIAALEAASERAA